MIRWLLIALFLYLLYKLIRGPKPQNKRNSQFRFGGFKKNNATRSNKNLDQIEEAEFEDITNKEKKTGNS